MRTFTDPQGFQDLDKNAPLNIIYNVNNRYQICHEMISPEGSFFLLIKIVDMEYDNETQIVSVNNFELKIIHAFIKESSSKYDLDIDAEDVVTLIEDEKDKAYHGEMVNLKVKIRQVNENNFEQHSVYKSTFGFKVNLAKEELLHFQIEEEGIIIDPTLKGVSRGQNCAGAGSVSKTG